MVEINGNPNEIMCKGALRVPLGDLERLVSDSRWLEAERELGAVLTLDSLTPRQRVGAMTLGCRVYNRLNQHDRPIPAGEMAVAMAAEIRDADLSGLARFELGAAYLYIGDSASAIECLTEALAGSDSNPAVPAQLVFAGQAWFHLGIAHRLREDWPAAIWAFGRAAARFRQGRIPLAEIRCWQDLTWCHLSAGDLDAAAVTRARAAEILDQYPDDCLGAHQACIQARCLLVRGNRAGAQALVEPVLSGTHGAEILATACWIGAEAALLAGRRHEARTRAEQALTHCQACTFPFVAAAAHALWRQATFPGPG